MENPPGFGSGPHPASRKRAGRRGQERFWIVFPVN